VTAPSNDSAAPRAHPTIYLVARREILIRLRSRVFAVGTVGMVALVVVGIVAASLLGGKTTPVPTPVRVGFSGGSQALEQSFARYAATLAASVTFTDIADPAAGTAQVKAGTLDVLVTGSATSPNAVVRDTVPSLVDSALYLAVVEARLGTAGLQPATIASLMAFVPRQAVQPGTPANPADVQNAIGALATAILLYVTLGLYGSQVAQGVVEEKATRMMEILLATIKPSELLAGKVIGIGLVGVLQLAIVAAAAVVAVHVTNVVSIPALGVSTILGDVLWFVLGFLLYATGYAALASLVPRQEEVQGAVAPMAIVMVAAYLLVFVALPDPTSPLIMLLSFLPPLAPILMTVRMASGDVALWQVGVAVALTLASIVGLTWLAGRIYANAALRLGTRVRFREAFRGE
jgi:ABC-2 type transport system permease protein